MSGPTRDKTSHAPNVGYFLVEACTPHTAAPQHTAHLGESFPVGSSYRSLKTHTSQRGATVERTRLLSEYWPSFVCCFTVSLRVGTWRRSQPLQCATSDRTTEERDDRSWSSDQSMNWQSHEWQDHPWSTSQWNWRRRKTAAERRAQRDRAVGRVSQQLLRGFKCAGSPRRRTHAVSR